MSTARKSAIFLFRTYFTACPRNNVACYVNTEMISTKYEIDMITRHQFYEIFCQKSGLIQGSPQTEISYNLTLLWGYGDDEW